MVLEIQLKRGDTFHKIETMVRFPMELDLGPYMAIDKAKPRAVNYSLHAVINHISHPHKHYTVYVKVNSNWYLFDDEEPPQRVKAENVVSHLSYILMYIRQ